VSRPGIKSGSPALHSSKELFEQLVYFLFGTTICAGIFTLLLSREFSPRHLAPPEYVFIEDVYSQGLDSLLTGNPGTHNVISSNHVGVTTIERLDQGHLYPLGERRDKHVTVGARTSDLLRHRRPLYLKSYLDSLFAGYSEPLLSLGARGRRSSTVC
jgi:hypothetical protein